MTKTFQAYMKNSKEAVKLYIKAFGATLGYHEMNEDGTYMHAEILVDGQNIISLSESDRWNNSGNNMQFCVNFGEENEAALKNAYEILIQEGQILYPIGPCPWNRCIADVIDKFGVRWYLAI